MNIVLDIITFVKVFMLSMSILYSFKVGYDIVKVSTLQEGKVDLGKNGLLYLACALSYIIAFIFG